MFKGHCPLPCMEEGRGNTFTKINLLPTFRQKGRVQRFALVSVVS